MKVKGRYVAQVVYDFEFDDSAPNARPVAEISNMFRSGEVESSLNKLLVEEAFDPSLGECVVTKLYFDMHELPEEKA